MTQAANPPLPPPVPPSDLKGLTTTVAKARAEAGLANRDTSHQRTDGDVVRANALSFFNIVLGSLIVALFAVGQFKDGLFVGIVVVANVAVSTYQELRAVRTLRELVALTAPHATVIRDGMEGPLLAEDVVQGDVLHLKQGDQVVADGHVVARNCEIDESLLTGESDSIRKGPGDELRSGSFCTAGDCFYTAEQVGIQAYALRLAADARQIVRRSSPLQVRFNRVLRVLLIATGVLAALLLIQYNNQDRGLTNSIRDAAATVSTVVPTGLLLGFTVTFAVGAVRVSRSGAIVQDIQAVEALNYTDVICLDKTGTITANKLTLNETRWESGADGYRPWLAAFAVASASDSKTVGALADAIGATSNGARKGEAVPFNSERRWSAMELVRGDEKRVFILGAPETVLPLSDGGSDLRSAYETASAQGLRGVVFAEAAVLPDPARSMGGFRPLALVTFVDVLRPEVRTAFGMMEQLGIEPKLISGDNPGTVAALLTQLGITTKGGAISGPELEAMNEAAFGQAVDAYTVFGRINPALKARIVGMLRTQGHFVAMVGDGANDVQALRRADVAVAMASGTGTARAVAGIVLLNDSFAALIAGAREATAVLGNAARLTKLFLAKSVYAFLIIVATNMLGLDFPFLPRQGSITALLTLGIPAVFIAVSVPPLDAGRDFIRSVLRFALPAGLALAAAAVIVHLFVQSVLGRDVADARTLVSLTVGITGLFFMVEVLGFEGASWRSLTRPVLTSALGAVLVLAFLLTISTPSLRHFFDFQQVRSGDWVIVIVAVIASLGGQFWLSRYWHVLIDFLTAKPRKEEELRGRAV